jgi:hypothetical protein
LAEQAPVDQVEAQVWQTAPAEAWDRVHRIAPGAAPAWRIALVEALGQVYRIAPGAAPVHRIAPVAAPAATASATAASLQALPVVPRLAAVPED